MENTRVLGFVFFFFLFTWDVFSASATADNTSSFWQHNNIFLSVITSRDA